MQAGTRRAIFQLHLWTGLLTGAYVFFMSITGSVLVYSNELYFAATPAPIVSTSREPLLSDARLTEAASARYPGYRVSKIARALNPDEAVDVWLRRGVDLKQRLFDPRTGADVGNAIPRGIVAISKLIDLHDNLLAGENGRRLNSAGAIALLIVAVTGIFIWRPSLATPASLRRFHSVFGICCVAFLAIFGISGMYLGNPQPFQNFADWMDPPSATESVRFVDKAIYWLAFLHFGRINGIGIPCSGPGFCDQATKAIWAIAGISPAVMFATGAILWWRRVLAPRRRASTFWI